MDIYCGMIGHLQAVGHVAGEADVKDGGSDSMVLDDVYDTGHERAGLPGKGAARFENHAEVRPAGVKVTQCLDEELNVVVLAGHEMTSAEVDPLEPGEPWGEFFYNMFECACECFCAALAVAVDVEAFDIGGEGFGSGEVCSEDSEAGTWRAGVVEFGFYLAVFGIDAEAEGDGEGARVRATPNGLRGGRL